MTQSLHTFTDTVHSKLFWKGNGEEVGFQPRCKVGFLKVHAKIWYTSKECFKMQNSF